MTTNVYEFEGRASSRDELSELIRAGARELISRAAEAGLQELLDLHAGRRGAQRLPAGMPDPDRDRPMAFAKRSGAGGRSC